VSSGTCLLTFEGHTNAVTSVSWSPDGRFALSASGDHTLRLWEIAGGQCLHPSQPCWDLRKRVWWPAWVDTNGPCRRTFEGHTNWVNSVSWGREGRRALSGSNDATVRLWEVSSGKCLHIFKGHTEGVTSVAWSPDGRFALSASSDNTLRLWDVSNG